MLAIFERSHNDIFLISAPPCFFLCKGFGGFGGGRGGGTRYSGCLVKAYFPSMVVWCHSIPDGIIASEPWGISQFLAGLYFSRRCCCIFVPVLLLLIAFSAFLGGDFCRIAWLITTVAIRNNNWTMPTIPSLTMMEMRSEHIQIRLRRPQRPSSLFSTCNMPPPLILDPIHCCCIYPSFEYPPTLDNWTMPCISDAPVQYDDVEGNGD